MLDAAGRNETDIVVVHTLDRWARKLNVQSEAFGVLGKVGVGFSSVMSIFSMTTPSGRLMLNTMGSVNEFSQTNLDFMFEKLSLFVLNLDCIQVRCRSATLLRIRVAAAER